MFVFMVFAASALPAWGNTAAYTRIVNQVTVSYRDGSVSRTVTAGCTVLVNLVAAAPKVTTGADQSTSYAGTGTMLSDRFTVTATSNGPDTYNLSAAITGFTNTSGAAATPSVGSIRLGASVTASGSTETNISVPSDGVNDGSVNGITAGNTVVINNEVRTVKSVVDNPSGVSVIELSAALSSAPAAGTLVAQQANIAVAVSSGTIVTPGSDITVSVNLTAVLQSGSRSGATSASLVNTYTSGLAALTTYVRNITHAEMAGDAAGSIRYGGDTFYATGVAARPGDVLEYLLVGNAVSGTISSAVITGVLQTSTVDLQTGEYSGAKDIAYVHTDGVVSYLTVAAGDDAAVYVAPYLTVNIGAGAEVPPAAGGTIAYPQTVRVLYRVKVSNLATQGSIITAGGRLSYAPDDSASSSSVVHVATQTTAAVDLLTYWPLNGSTGINVSASAYRTGSASTDSLVVLTAPVPYGLSSSLDLSQPVPLAVTSRFRPGEPFFIRVADGDQNLNSSLSETVWVTLNNAANGDVEVVRLTETGPDTGVFVGYLPTSTNSVVAYNGSLSIEAGQTLSIRYVDALDGSATNRDDLELVDPYGVVFDSASGLPVNGATISVTTDTGGSVTVYGDDGVSIYPSTVTSGGSVNDSSGREYTFPPGEYRFPFLPPGTYQFRIVSPAGYVFPSAVATSTIQALPGAPFAIVDGSRGEAFVLNAGYTLRIDVPLDSSSASLWLQKTVNKDTAGHGDLIAYRLTVANASALNVGASGVHIMDTMPVGFRYRGGSARQNSTSTPDPLISADGRTLTFSVGALAAGASATVDYVAEVTAGTRLGDAINSAVAFATGEGTSNTARVKVKIKDDFMKTRSFLMGRISTGACHDHTGDGADGVEGVRVYMEDGSFVLSDKQGMFHFEGVRAGLHVVQLDPDSLPEGYEAVSCKQNSRFAGSASSQFVETQGGTLWRVDFYLRQKQTPEKNTGGDASKNAEAKGTISRPSTGEKQKEAIAGMDPDGIVSPEDQEVLVNGINTVRIRLDSTLTPRLLLDGKEVPGDRIGFTMKNGKTGKTDYSFIGVDFGEKGNHVVALEGVDPFGVARLKKTVSVRRSGEIASIRLKSTAGNVADGKTPVKLYLEIFDTEGNLIPAGAELEIREGSLAQLKRTDVIEEPPATGNYPRVSMSREGEVRFQPVNNSGLYRVVLGYNAVTVEAETYVQPKMRDWILVGLAEGTAGYNTVSGHMENLASAGGDEHLYQNGRIALFAKGRIKGKWLLTLAYDSAKTKENSGNSLFQTINPDTYYTLYGDASQQQYDASSTNKLYLKIEREQFYAMFGDFDTGLTIAELSKYSRRMTGIKTELQGAHYELNAFAGETTQTYKKDEIPGDGTSGMYHLSSRNIVSGSEKITIEVRDRFRSEVLISSRVLSRFTDYSIDYDAGSVIFKEPVFSRDENFNPIIIVAEYENVYEGGRDYTYGGRAGIKLFNQKLKAGGSYIHEGRGDQGGDLYGADASLKLDDRTKVRAEIATSRYTGGAADRSGNAYLLEAMRTAKKYHAKVYFREQEEGFGLGQQPGSEAGTRKIGLEGSYRFENKMSAGVNAYRQYNFLNDAMRDVAEGKLTYNEKKYGASVGFLHANDNLADGSNRESNQLTLGGKFLTLNERLTLSVNHAHSIGKNDNSDYPTRTTLGAELALNKVMALYAAQEFTWGSAQNTQNTRIGMRASPWTGANVNSSVGRQFNEDYDRVFANVGLKQNWRISEAWKVDAGVERSQTVAKSGYYIYNANVSSASGNVQSLSGATEDFTAVSGGATYQAKKLTWNNRMEFRMAETENKWGLLSGMVKEVSGNWAWSGRVQYFQTSASSGIDTTKADIRFGLVHRPPQTTWIALNRLDFLINGQSGNGGADLDSWRLVDNLMMNYRPQKELEFSFHYGAKYVQEKVYDAEYGGYTDLMGVEGRYDIGKNWDIGLQGSVLHSWSASVFDYSGGLSVGYNIMQNAWLSLGYNVIGFQDKDFSQANFTAQGPFIRIRFKFDQNSVADAAKWLSGSLSPGDSQSETVTGPVK